MSDRAAVLEALTTYAHTPVISPDELAVGPAELFGRPPFSTLVQFVQTLGTRVELDQLLAEVAPLVRAPDPFRGSVIAINCGSLVEFGGDPGLVAGPLLTELPRHLALARRLRERSEAEPNDEELFAEDPDGLKAARGLSYMLLPTMAVLCRAMEYRQAARANPDIVEGVAALRESNREAGFVAQVLGFTDGVELLVLAPRERKGFRVALEAVASNFHLFTLLQAALIGGGHLAGEALDEEVVGVATGELPHHRLLSDHARFHFATWQALLDDSGLAHGVLGTWIPGEGSPADIPRLDGRRVVVLGPTVLGLRAWDSNFFANIHDALRSRAEVVKVLSDEEFNRWTERIERERN